MTLGNIIVAVFASTAVMFCTAPRMISFFGTLSAPVIQIRRKRQPVTGVSIIELASLARGFFRLWSIYFIISFIFALTGGTISANVPSNINIPRREAIVYGIMVGALLCGIARVVSVNTSSFIVKQLLFLVLAALGSLVMQYFLNPNLLTIISDKYLKEALFILPAYTFASTSIVCFSIEGLIYASHYFGKQGSKMVPYAVITERMEEHERVEQVFIGRAVRKRTNEIIRDVIKNEGPRDVCWLTNTAPEDHISELRSATSDWVQKRYPTTNSTQREKIADMFFCKGMRIIAKEEQIREIADQLSCIKQFQQIQAPVRTRLLILNNSIAIVHLPIPFTSDPDEESNFAAIVTHPERVHQLKNIFDSFWANTMSSKMVDFIHETRRDRNDISIAILGCLCQNGSPWSFDALCSKLEATIGRLPEENQIRQTIKQLESKLILQIDSNQNIRRISPLHDTMEELLYLICNLDSIIG